MPFIYKITNCITGKSYVGKTICSVDKRWREHKFAAANNRNYPLYRAMRKYGIENFKIEEIECCSADILSEREIYWIKELGTFNNGYNATLGGEGTALIDYETIIDVYCLTENAQVTAEILGVHRQAIRYALRMYGLPALPQSTRTEQAIGTAVSQFTPDGQYLRSFPSISQASDFCLQNGLTKSRHAGVARISANCRGTTRSAYGYKWEYMIPENFEDEDW